MKILRNIYYVYLYRDPKDNTPIYVGKGKNNRVFAHFANKNKTYLGNLLKKRIKDGYDPQPIIVYCENEQTALDMEVFWIAFYGRKDLGLGTLFNLTDGGEGVSGHLSPTKGIKYGPNPKITEALTGKKREPFTQEHKDKLSVAHKGIPLKHEGQFIKGSESWNSGRPGYKNKSPKVIHKKTCTHCGKVATPSNIVRWHNDNCKILKDA